MKWLLSVAKLLDNLPLHYFTLAKRGKNCSPWIAPPIIPVTLARRSAWYQIMFGKKDNEYAVAPIEVLPGRGIVEPLMNANKH